MATFGVAHAATTGEAVDPPRRGRGRPPRTERQRAAQRARLVAAAMDAIRKHGPDTTIVQIAKEAGITKPVVFAEFGDKLGVGNAIALTLAGELESEVIAKLASSTSFDIQAGIEAVIDALVALVVREPEIYEFLVRLIRTSDQGFLDNALVRVLHERAQLVVGLVTPGAPRREVEILTDGMFGFVFAAVESWQSDPTPDRARLVTLLTETLRAGLTAMVPEVAPRTEPSR